ncbi:TIGR01440 family protein [Domibacillus sp. A3M-37]|uniref:TIGR01440 family protein n=1 Tax=Domibacillus sp. A3M-37 TaxID=2962037 RepID=UPI0020B6F6AB|nr:TIGR01440 family protein [Domibacillus sp. A3M-37]MCP3761481.1 TIGR01440 family protein [Domibacillus sp. A3M-37]
MDAPTAFQQALETILLELQEQAQFKKGQLFIVGCSTSEVAGGRIGTAGTDETAAALYEVLDSFAKKTGVHLAFQCCEHLNRAVVLERQTAEKFGYDEVAAVPVRTAGGAMAAYAFGQKDCVLVEFVKADGGIDIGDTFIGMHLKHVAVPVRTSGNSVGAAHVTMARTRPKLIGGPRAVYEKTNVSDLNGPEC